MALNIYIYTKILTVEQKEECYDKMSAVEMFLGDD